MSRTHGENVACNPKTIFDLPYGAGRFWPILAENTGGRLPVAAKASRW